MLVVVDSARGRIYGPFKFWEDAEHFSDTVGKGAWGIVDIEAPYPIGIYERDGNRWYRKETAILLGYEES